MDILVVDDETEMAALVARGLNKDGHNVRTASTGLEGLACALEHPFDVAVLDVMMPGMDGPQTLEQLVNLVDINVVPVAFMTAKVQPAEVEHYLSLGARDVIIKPFDPMQLASQIRAIWSLSNG